MKPILTYEAREVIKKAFCYFVLFVITVVFCFPMVWCLSTSFKPAKELFANPPTIIPNKFTLTHYKSLIYGKSMYYEADVGYKPDSSPPQHFLSWFLNSTIVTLGVTLISVVVSTLAAYSLTRFEYAGRKFIPYFALLSYMVPSIILVFPLFLVMVKFHVVNTLFSLILGYISITLPFSMWLMWAFFRGIPIEIEEAALIDGASRLKVFFQIVLPVAMPGVISAAIFSFLVAWNDYLIARIFINAIEKLPLTVGVMHFFEGVHVNWGLMMASAVLMTVPLILLFMFLQKQLVAGFGAGAVKG